MIKGGIENEANMLSVEAFTSGNPYLRDLVDSNKFCSIALIVTYRCVRDSLVLLLNVMLQEHDFLRAFLT